MNSKLYFDYCATTPIHPSVRQEMAPVLEGIFGNPSSMHNAGTVARSQVETAREIVAVGIGASPDEIIFTSGATEANNLTLIGATQAFPENKHHIIVSAIEHHSTLHTAAALADRGFQVTYLPVDYQGLISLTNLEAAIRPETGLISIMMANNEVGSVQDISSIGKIAQKHDLLFHTDAVQSINCFEIDVMQFNIDMLSLSAHKIYGPKGVGALYIRKGTQLDPIFFGGAQERKIRPGTENVPGIVGLGAAMRIRNEKYQTRSKQLFFLRKELIKIISKINPLVIFNGPVEQIAPQILSVCFPEINGELLLYHLNQRGVSISMGSACTSESLEPSHVLNAMSLSAEQIEGTLRISFGDFTQVDDLYKLGEILTDVLPKSRADYQ